MMSIERKRMQVGDKRGEEEGCQTCSSSATEEQKERERKWEVIVGWRAMSSSVWEQQGLFQSNRHFKRLSWQKGKLNKSLNRCM